MNIVKDYLVMKTISFVEMERTEGGKVSRNGCIIFNEVMCIAGLITLAQPELAGVYAIAAVGGFVASYIGLMTC